MLDYNYEMSSDHTDFKFQNDYLADFFHHEIFYLN